MSDFEYAEASVIGRDHREAGRNNQDAYLSVDRNGLEIHLVADGCGSGPSSEVGARIGLRVLAKSLADYAPCFDPLNPGVFFEAVRISALSVIRFVASSMDGRLSEIVRDHFLFTVVGAMLTPDNAIFFKIGDGKLMVNGEDIPLGSYPNNEPPYLSYGIVNTTLSRSSPDPWSFKVLKVINITDLNSFLLGTDGVEDLVRGKDIMIPGKSEPVGEIERLWQEDRYFRNPDALRRRLFLINRDSTLLDADAGRLIHYPGLLPDDTTIIVGRRKEKEP